MKYWTGRGDTGKTGLFGGRKVSKSDLRVDVYGTVDELNSFVGLAKSVASEDILDILGKLQHKLFVLGSDLSTPVNKKNHRIAAADVAFIESFIEGFGKETDDISSFILPDGTELSSRLHVCRAICRRAERFVVRLSEKEDVNEESIKFLNRLSSLFFVMARAANKRAGVEEVEWQKS